MVLSRRRLSQSPSCTVGLDCSATNCHKYEVLVSDVMLLVYSNMWYDRVGELRHDGGPGVAVE